MADLAAIPESFQALRKQTESAALIFPSKKKTETQPAMSVLTGSSA